MSISRIGHVGLTVPELDSWTDFFQETIGLQVTERTPGSVYLSCSHRWAEIRLTVGDRYGCDGVGLDVESAEALDSLIGAAPRFGLEVVGDGPDATARRVVQMVGAGLPVLELCHGSFRAPVGYDAAYDTLGPRPRKLGHFTFLSSDLARTADLLENFLGFRLSDSIPGAYQWFRCNADHHGIGVGNAPDSPADALHHYAFQLTSFDEFRMFGDHVARQGRQLAWGPGRHGPGNNLFAYLLDPGGGMVEVYTDLLQIQDEENYRPSEFTHEQAGNVWGPGTVPPESWLTAATPYLSPSPVQD